ncbi:MAG TPA: hypothetical protein VLI93_09755 [Acetobacteraceae bacterium]|nr:hypothetical protein [Acetobacteraceae bacterium]
MTFVRPTTLRDIMFAAALFALTGAIPTSAASEWLSLCSKCLSPSITSKSGLGTAHATAEGKITRQDAESWCANWQPDSKLKQCVAEQLATDEAKQTYRATAGRIIAIDGATYTQAGRWTSGGGRGGAIHPGKSWVRTTPAMASRSPSSGKCCTPVPPIRRHAPSVHLHPRPRASLRATRPARSQPAR